MKVKKLTYQDGFRQGYDSQKNLSLPPTPRHLLAPYIRTAFQRGYIAGQNKAWAETKGIKK